MISNVSEEHVAVKLETELRAEVARLTVKLREADAALCYLRKLSQYPTLYDMPDEIAASIKEAQDRQALLKAK
jgi:hypothetical protein